MYKYKVFKKRLKKMINYLSIKDNKRDIALDIVRILAIICVIICHCTESIYSVNQDEWNTISILSGTFRTVAFTLGRLGVPLFLFITGALVLKKKIDSDDDVMRFYRKNLMPLLIVSEIWIVIYNIYMSLAWDMEFSFELLVKQMAFLELTPMNHFWYIPTIIGFYLVIPFISKILKTFSIKTLRIPLIIAIFISFIIPTINIVLSIFKVGESYSSELDYTFLGGFLGIYVILGYLIKNGLLKCIKNWFITLIGMISFILLVVIQIISFNHGVGYKTWYDSFFILIASVAIFEFINRIEFKNINILNRVITYLSKITFGVFLIHTIVIKEIRRLLIDNANINKSFKVIILSIIVYVVSVLIIYLFSRIKYVGKKVFLIKD